MMTMTTIMAVAGVAVVMMMTTMTTVAAGAATVMMMMTTTTTTITMATIASRPRPYWKNGSSKVSGCHCLVRSWPGSEPSRFVA
ncbi:hypothetical protein V6617_04770 [Pelagibacterium nitratireducens]|uniref:Secreted protein n=1 Tax=Pelagibacterium nitratireducens TaxID=1046114 RepID=A0ABZ2I4A1_9HYPH